MDRIFITGVAPITLDSLTSGFNIGLDMTQDRDLNEMMGFTEEELRKLMKEQNISKEEQEEILPIMKENYDGYRFSLKGKEKMYNSNMCLYFLNSYIRFKEIPNQLIDVNIASDYSKLGKMLDLCKGENRAEIIEKTVSGEGILADIVEKFNPAMEFEERELVSMLYYLGYLTISEEKLGRAELKIPNKVMREIYSEYFMKILNQATEMEIKNSEYNEILEEIALEGKIEEKQREAKAQIERYANTEEMKDIEKMNKYTIVVVNDKLYVEKIKS